MPDLDDAAAAGGAAGAAVDAAAAAVAGNGGGAAAEPVPDPSSAKPGVTFDLPKTSASARQFRKRPSFEGLRPRGLSIKQETVPSSPGVDQSVVMLQDSSWCYPAEGAQLAYDVGIESEHPFWRDGGRVIPPQKAFRAAGPYGLAPKSLSNQEADYVDSQIEREFIGATLCGRIKITTFLLAGGYGRGWAGELTDAETGKVNKVFVKTLGVLVSDADTPKAREDERKARIEAKVYNHKWFPPAVDQPGAAIQRLCRGRCVNKRSGFDGDIFFVCGELCGGGDLWAYHVHKESFADPFARRIFGQLARGLNTMKHAGELGNRLAGHARLLAFSTAGEGPLVKGCFHRDLKLENVIVSDAFDTKIMDYGSLKFTDQATQRVGPNGKANYTTMTPWQGTDVFKPPSFFYESPHTVVSDGYDPAAWDVWSLGTILLYLCAGRSLYRRLKGDVYRFFELTLRIRPDDPGEAAAWDRKRWKVDNQCVFYETDENGAPVTKDARGIPVVERVPCSKTPAATAANPTGRVGAHCPAQGVPTNARLWHYLAEIDPDRRRLTGPPAPGDPPRIAPVSPLLKDLINRILDVDPETRIPIEDVCEHPWLQSHQAPGNGTASEAVETPEQRELYVGEMHRRFTKYVDTASSGCVVKCKLTVDRAFALIREYADLETHLLARRVANGPGDASKGSFPTFEVYRAKGRDAMSPMHRPADGDAPLPIYRVTAMPGHLYLQWVRNRAVLAPDGGLVNASATLGEWYNFKESVREMVAAIPGASPPRRGGGGVKKGGVFDDCVVS